MDGHSKERRNSTFTALKRYQVRRLTKTSYQRLLREPIEID